MRYALIVAVLIAGCGKSETRLREEAFLNVVELWYQDARFVVDRSPTPPSPAFLVDPERLEKQIKDFPDVRHRQDAIGVSTCCGLLVRQLQTLHRLAKMGHSDAPAMISEYKEKHDEATKTLRDLRGWLDKYKSRM